MPYFSPSPKTYYRSLTKISFVDSPKNDRNIKSTSFEKTALQDPEVTPAGYDELD